jgi:hypothetical protein
LSQTGFLQQHKARLIVEIASLRRQAEVHNNPSTFHKSAKFQRLANAKEKELASLQATQQPSLQDTIDQLVVIAKVRPLCLSCSASHAPAAQEPQQHAVIRLVRSLTARQTPNTAHQ